MKTKYFILALMLMMGVIPSKPVQAENEGREVPAFSAISLRIPGTLYLEQGNRQQVEIEAKSSTLEEIITEVKGRTLIIRFPNKNYLWKTFDPGKIIIHVTLPEIDGLNVSGSGDIVAEDGIKSRILNLNVSGSGDIRLNKLESDRVEAAISGSGDIEIERGGPATDFSATVSGSGNVKAGGFEARDVMAKIAGSGNVTIRSNGKITARIAGSGNVYYFGNPAIDSSVAGSGSVKKAR